MLARSTCLALVALPCCESHERALRDGGAELDASSSTDDGRSGSPDGVVPAQTDARALRDAPAMSGHAGPIRDAGGANRGSPDASDEGAAGDASDETRHASDATSSEASLVPHDALPPGPTVPDFGPGFAELIGPIESAVSLVVPAFTGYRGATLGVIRDLDRDGVPEVVLSGPTGSQDLHPILAYDAATRSLSERGRLGPIDLLALADLDDDGETDLLARQPFGVAWGVGAGAFGQIGSNFAPSAPMNIVLEDVDRDGWLDLVADAPDPGEARDLVILLRTGPRTFANRSDLVPPVFRTCPFALAAGDLHPNEKLLMVFGSPCQGVYSPSSGIYRESGVDAEGYPTFEPFDPTPPGLPFARITPDAGIASRTPMGGAIGDLDDDGFPELAIAFGEVAALFGGGPGWPLADRTAISGFGSVEGTVAGSAAIPWGMAFVDLDQDGRKDVVTAHGNDVGAWFDPHEPIGPQRTTVHWNADGTRFVDVSEELGLGRVGQWKALAVGDLEGDGDADLVVGGQAELPRIYRNDVASGNHGFALRLHGTTSNHLGLGARVEVIVRDGDQAQRHISGGISSPYAMSEGLVFVGLGSAVSARWVRITWPSGVVQDLADVPAGAVHPVEEPALLVVSPSTRHQPADGASEFVVVVSPRDPSGTIRVGATVSASVTGAGSLVGQPVPRGDGSFEIRVVAPGSSGSAVLHAVIDGVAAGVSPRLWWD